MKKSIYSLVLSDAVVEAADRLAYVKGTSRSALIDELLAQSLSCVTPEMRMRDIFVSLEALMENNQVFKLQSRGSDSMLSLFSALSYKYRPTIRYSIELYRQIRGNAFGELKIQSRTQSRQLLQALEDFYRLWMETEQAFAGNRVLEYSMSEGRLCRRLQMPPGQSGCTEAELGQGIGAYLQSFDRGMKAYFDSAGDRRIKAERLQSIYADYLRQKTLHI